MSRAYHRFAAETSTARWCFDIERPLVKLRPTVPPAGGRLFRHRRAAVGYF
jgi:hypothetical protein